MLNKSQTLKMKKMILNVIIYWISNDHKDSSYWYWTLWVKESVSVPMSVTFLTTFGTFGGLSSVNVCSIGSFSFKSLRAISTQAMHWSPRTLWCWKISALNESPFLAFGNSNSLFQTGSWVSWITSVLTLSPFLSFPDFEMTVRTT